MRAITSFSIQPELLEAVDEAAWAAHKTRSRFIADVLSAFLEESA